MVFKGIIVPLITPFTKDLSLDIDAAKWLARYLSKEGIDALFPCSTTGEYVHLSRDECIELTKAILEEVRGRTKVIPGITANTTIHVIELGKAMKDLGVDGVVVSTPYYFKISRDMLKDYFSKVAEKVDLPIMIYNIPQFTGINIPVELYRELATEYSNIVSAKITYDSLSYLRSLIANVRSIRKDFTVLTGLDDHILPALVLGADGGVVATAHIAPKVYKDLYNAWISGDISEAYRLYKIVLELVKILDIASSVPSAIKTSLYILGAPVKPYVRPPLRTESEDVVARIRYVLSSLKISLPKSNT